MSSIEQVRIAASKLLTNPHVTGIEQDDKVHLHILFDALADVQPKLVEEVKGSPTQKVVFVPKRKRDYLFHYLKSVGLPSPEPQYISHVLVEINNTTKHVYRYCPFIGGEWNATIEDVVTVLPPIARLLLKQPEFFTLSEEDIKALEELVERCEAFPRIPISNS